MTSRPIIFSAPMVRAILEGRKTMTRRIVKPQPQPNGGVGFHPVSPYHRPDGLWTWVLANHGMGVSDPFRCPYGAKGDELWCKETFALYSGGMTDCGEEWDEVEGPPDPDRTDYAVQYAADGVCAPDRWRPSIHMPRWASRITLTITADSRVERVQDISQEDATKEGIERYPSGWKDYQGFPPHVSARDAFASLWESINGPGAWIANPWVWVVSFERKEG